MRLDAEFGASRAAIKRPSLKIQQYAATISSRSGFDFLSLINNSQSAVILKTDNLQEFQSVISANLRPARITPKTRGKQYFFYHQIRLDNAHISLLTGEGAIDIGLSSCLQQTCGYVFWVQLSGSSSVALNDQHYEQIPEFHACIARSNVQGSVCNSSNSRQFFILFDRPLLEGLWDENELPLAELDRGIPIKLPSLIGSTLQRYVHFVMAEINNEWSVAYQPAVAQQTEKLLITLLAQTLSKHHLQAFTCPDAREPAYIAAVEKLMLDNLNKGIGVADLVAESGVSMSTLYRGFKTYKGCGPMTFYRNKQLELVHARLLEAEPGHTSVTDIAYRFGFFHLSNFATLYKRKFGCLPSVTLNKKP